ncbi:MAG: tRNA (adenosine(37)-N6)-threonylcarbamoyltransferase complex transferase subunit TsaD [Deltaproteobacteria bacterium]|nr:tRNA (adenosine(37)-N6)-threonylcarbamoyltransferase complex transferase subunit TsaD [Deltaproteobacteria bacterium]
MRCLAIETSCDETAVAILHDGEICADLIASQHETHAAYGGIVPELAARRQMEMLPPMVAEALSRAHCALADIDGIAVTRAPGLLGSLLVGLSFAKALAFAADKPLIGVNHLEGHLHAVRVTAPAIAYPYLALVVSGGHTSIYQVHDFGRYELLGATRDDAAGEAFDKVARLLGLGYPGGPLIDNLSAQGNPRAVRFARPKVDPGSHFEIGPYDMSFSGFKTAVARWVAAQGGAAALTDAARADCAASFQHAAVETLVHRLGEAARGTAPHREGRIRVHHHFERHSRGNRLDRIPGGALG